MRCEHCREEFFQTRSDARFCSGRCRVAAHRARLAAAEAAAIREMFDPAPANTDEKVQILEDFVLNLIRRYDPKLASEVDDRDPEDRIPFAINRAVDDDIIELPRQLRWRAKRTPVLIRLARFIFRPRRARAPGYEAVRVA